MKASFHKFAKLPLSSPSCAINGDWLLWETPLLDNRLEFKIEKMPWQPQQDMAEFLKEVGDAIRSFHAIQAGSCESTAQINDRHSAYWQEKQAHAGP